jgi:hypothetical protein
MPNGESKNRIRFLAAIEGFRARFGKWPSRVRIPSYLLEDLQARLAPEEFSVLEAKIKLVCDGSPMIAEDDFGNTYDYGKRRIF